MFVGLTKRSVEMLLSLLSIAMTFLKFIDVEEVFLINFMIECMRLSVVMKSGSYFKGSHK